VMVKLDCARLKKGTIKNHRKAIFFIHFKDEWIIPPITINFWEWYAWV